MNETTDRIERAIVLRAPRERVWRALTDHREFGTWFGVVVAAPFAPGKRLEVRVTTPAYENLKFPLVVQKVDPPRYFAWRWHPAAIDPSFDYSKEPMTLVEFTLEEIAGGTRLTVVESGFDAISVARRAEAFRLNTAGWTAQLDNIERHVRENS